MIPVCETFWKHYISSLSLKTTAPCFSPKRQKLRLLETLLYRKSRDRYYINKHCLLSVLRTSGLSLLSHDSQPQRCQDHTSIPPSFFNIKSQIQISPSILLQILKVHTLSSTYIYILFKKGKLYKYVFASFVYLGFPKTLEVLFSKGFFTFFLVPLTFS